MHPNIKAALKSLHEAPMSALSLQYDGGNTHASLTQVGGSIESVSE